MTVPRLGPWCPSRLARRVRKSHRPQIPMPEEVREIVALRDVIMQGVDRRGKPRSEPTMERDRLRVDRGVDAQLCVAQCRIASTHARCAGPVKRVYHHSLECLLGGVLRDVLSNLDLSPAPCARHCRAWRGLRPPGRSETGSLVAQRRPGLACHVLHGPDGEPRHRGTSLERELTAPVPRAASTAPTAARPVCRWSSWQPPPQAG